MILIHGDCGSGKSRALHALELAPPADLRAVYVPVPTLEFAGLARWCLDQLKAAAGDDPVAALRAVVGQRRVLMLVDDAHRLPLETALALRQFERAAKGQLVVVAACGSEERRGSSVVALGEPAACIELAPERGQGAEAVAAEVRAVFSEGAQQRSAAARPQQLAARAPAAPRASAEPMPARELPAPAPALAPAPTRAPSAPLVAAAKPPRTIPLGFALALVCIAFLIPVAFGAGFLLGRRPPVAELAASASPDRPPVLRPVLPPVAAEPPPPREQAATAPAAIEALPHSAPANEEPELSPAQAPVPIAAAPAPERVVAIAPSVPARPAEAAAEAPEWGTPTLISVAPAGDAP